MPNAGFPTADDEAHLSYHLETGYFRDYTERYGCGASVVGGCCGVSAGHIAAIADLADSAIVTKPQAVAKRLQATTKP